MTVWPHTQRIKELTDELAEIGKEKYKSEYQDKIPYWQKVGGALCDPLFGNQKGALQMVYEILEDMNAHAMCCVLSWAFPRLDQPEDMNYFAFDPNKKYLIELESVQRLINRNNVTVLTDWNTETHDYNIRHARVTVNVEWLD
jgi:hypothetical protein